MCADAYDAEPAREPSPTPAPRFVVLICHSTLLATSHVCPSSPNPLSIDGFRPVQGGHSGGLFLVCRRSSQLRVMREFERLCC
jgi:hypothetical protein